MPIRAPAMPPMVAPRDSGAIHPEAASCQTRIRKSTFEIAQRAGTWASGDFINAQVPAHALPGVKPIARRLRPDPDY